MRILTSALCLTLGLTIPALATGCKESKTDQTVSQQPDPQRRETFNKLLASSLEGLRLATEANRTWGFGEFDHWDFNQDKGLLVFTDPEKGRAETSAQIAGTYDAQDGSWVWGWANPSVSEKLKSDSLRVKQLGEREGYPELTQPRVKCTEQDAWSLAALVMRMGERNGVYRGPAGNHLFAFLVFGSVKVTGPEGK